MVKGFYKIYIGENLLQLVESKDLPFILLKNDSETIIDSHTDKGIIEDCILMLEKDEFSRIVLHDSNVNDLFELFKELFICIPAAGGIIENSKGEILSILRRGHWDFPKGKIEIGEKKKEAAIREVKEECGLKNIEVQSKLGTTYHTFGNKDKRKLKISYWYVMSSDDIKLKPQTEEDIEKVEWFDIKDFMLRAKPVYRNIEDVLEAFIMKFR